MGRSPSTVKTVLSAAMWALSMGIAEHNVPRFFWKYVKGAENTWDEKKVLWESVAALQTMADQAHNSTEWAVVTAVLSTVAGLRVGEVEGVKVRGRDGIKGTIIGAYVLGGVHGVAGSWGGGQKWWGLTHCHPRGGRAASEDHRTVRGQVHMASCAYGGGG